MRNTTPQWIMLLLTMFVSFTYLADCSNNAATPSLNGFNPPQSSPTYTTEPLLFGKGEITSFATYSTNLFWSDGAYEHGIWKYSVNDNADPVLLVPRLNTPKVIVVRGNYIYWVDTGTRNKLYKTTLDGSETTLLREGSNSQSKQIIVDDKAVYWINASGDFSRSFEKIPLDGSSPQTIYTTSNAIRALSTDGTYIYWLENVNPSNYNEYTLFRVPKTGGAVETLCQGLIDWGGVLGVEPSVNMAVYNNYVYLGLNREVLKIPSAGGSPSIIAQGPEVCPMGLTIYDSNLYWLNHSSSGLPQYGGDAAILSVPTDTTTAFSIIASNLGSPKSLHASADGLVWAQLDQNYKYNVKKLSWGAGSSETIATGIYFGSSDLVGDQLFFTEILEFFHYSQIGMVSLATGTRETLFGGLNNTAASLIAGENYLILGDGHALKKVSVNGGKVETLLVGDNLNEIDFSRLYESDGWIYFSFGGIYKIPLSGGEPTLLGKDISSRNIISIQGGYVYYVCDPSSTYNGSLLEMHRLPINGGVPELVYKMQPGRYLAAFDGITTVYEKEWIWNDQYKLLMIDIATGKESQLCSGRIRFLGMNAEAVFLDDWNGFIYRVPKYGGTSRDILTVSYPLTLDYLVSAGAEDFYLVVSYLDGTQGYFSEIDLLKRLN